jgi:hypothetical protein
MNWVRQRALCSLYFFIAQNSVAAGNLLGALRSWKQVRRRRLGWAPAFCTSQARPCSYHRPWAYPVGASTAALPINGRAGCG